MEEKISINPNRNSQNKINKQIRNSYKYESKKKFIFHNPLLTSKNNDKANDNLHLMKYMKPFHKSNKYKLLGQSNLSEKECANKNQKDINNKVQNKYEEIKEDKKDNKNREKFLTYKNENRDKYLPKDEEELVTTSFEKKPSEIQSPSTISEDSFLTEVSKINQDKNINDKKDQYNYNNDEDIVNYDKEEYNKFFNKNVKENKEEKDDKTNIKKFKKENIKKNKIIFNNKIRSCKKIISDEYYKGKIGDLVKNSKNENNKKNKLNIKVNSNNESQDNQQVSNNELKENTSFFFHKYRENKEKPKITTINIYYNQNFNNNNSSKDIDINIEKNNCDSNFLKSLITKNKKNIKFELDIEQKNSALNNSNIYIPVNQRKKITTSRKNLDNEDKNKIVINTPKNKNIKNLKDADILLNSTEIKYNSKRQMTRKFDSEASKKQKNIINDSIGIITKNILNDFNDDGINNIDKKNKVINNKENKHKNTPNNVNIKKSNIFNMKYNKNIIKKSFIQKNNNIDKKSSFLDNNLNKNNITNINFYKNNIKNNLIKRHNKLCLSIDDFDDIKKIKKSCNVSKICNKSNNKNNKNSMVYAPKKPSLVQSKNKKKKDCLYNRASYDPNKSNYNTIRKKNFFKQSITVLDLMNCNKRHTRNHSGSNYSKNFNDDKKSKDFLLNKYNSMNNNIFDDNSLNLNKNILNLKIINNMNRSYDSNFYPNLNKSNYLNENNLKDKELDLEFLSQNQILDNRILNNNINKTPNKNNIKHNTYLNNTMRENERKTFNIFTNNINKYLDFDNPALKYNIRTNKDYFNNSNNNINIINSNNNIDYEKKERKEYFPKQRNLNLELMNPYNVFNNNFNFHNYQNQSNLINFYNNNLIEQNKLLSLSQNIKNNENNNYNLGLNINLFNYLNNQQKLKNLPFTLKLEDLLLLLEKFNNIIIGFNDLNNGRIVFNECFEFLNYYYNCSTYCQLEKLFLNGMDSNEVRVCINYCLMSVIILYDYSFEMNALKNEFVVINNLLKLNYMNLMLISEHILKMVTTYKAQINNANSLYNNFLILKLYKIIEIFRKKGGFENDFVEIKPFLVVNDLDMSNVEKISYNTNLIIQYLRYALKNNKTSRNEILTIFFKKIKEKTYDEINIFFREHIFRIINKNGSILASAFLKNIQLNNLNNNLFSKNFRTVPAPYLRTKNNKNYSLVLDLDETLIHFKQGKNDLEGVVRIRPGVTEFLEEVGKYYELIIFTTATQEYADLLIDSVEEDKIYFDHRLYREHATIIDNDFVKDLTRIGRPLDKIIIVDNMPQNFKLQKENGIIIRPFWGEDTYDQALFNLIPILINIAKDGGDVRIGLIKYKDEIFKNITSVLYA